MDLQIRERVAKFRFGLKARIGLYERLAAFLEAGIPVFETVETIKARYQKRRDFRAVIMEEWLQVMRDGTRFSEAIKEWVPSSEYMLISSGERGQGLPQGLHEAVRLSSAAANIKKSIIMGSAMPVVLFLMLLGMLAGFDLKMAPVFMVILPLEKWPGSAQTLKQIGDLVVHYFFIWALVAAGIGGVIAWTMSTWTGPIREVFDRLPPWSIYKNYQASSFLIALSSMLKAGVALSDSLKAMLRNANPWMSLHLGQMLSALRGGGSNYGEAMNTGLFDEETAGDLQDYSRLSSFERAIGIIGERMIVEGVERTNARMAVARNLMLFLVAGTVFWIYGTSYNLQNVIAESSQQRATK
jgi:type II secretory pathway component PulF